MKCYQWLLIGLIVMLFYKYEVISVLLIVLFVMGCYKYEVLSVVIHKLIVIYICALRVFLGGANPP